MMRQKWSGVATLDKVASLLRHIVSWVPSHSYPCEVLGLVDWATSLLSHPAGLRQAIRECASEFVDRCQSGSVDEQEFLWHWHLSQFLKKFRFECAMSPETAVSQFITRDERTGDLPRLPWYIRLRMRELLNRALPLVTERHGRFGPGATLDGGSTWASKLRYVSSFHALGYRIWDGIPPIVSGGAKLHAVPKDLEKLRTISVEPLVSQWHQQGARQTILDSIHHGPLRGTVMDLDQRQTRNLPSGVSVWRPGLVDSVLQQRHRAYQGALNGRLSTLDLSNASDTIPFTSVQDVFPAWVLQMLEECRSEKVTFRNTEHTLKMYAGMGNATTFVVETLYFWALLTAIGEHAMVGKPSVTVFGDDIVMSTRVARHSWFQATAKRCGLEINTAKSGLSAGPGFREACGMVAYHAAYIPSTLRFYGYAATLEGAIGYCDITSRCLNACHPVLKALGECLLTWEGAPKAPLLSVQDGYESSLCFRIPDTGMLEVNVPLRPVDVPVRWNRRLCRTEHRLPTIEARTARIIVKDPIWGPGVIRSWGYWAYKLSLLGCTPVQGVRDLPKAREVSYAIPHRTKVRQRWIPSRFIALQVDR